MISLDKLDSSSIGLTKSTVSLINGLINGSNYSLYYTMINVLTKFFSDLRSLASEEGSRGLYLFTMVLFL